VIEHTVKHDAGAMLRDGIKTLPDQGLLLLFARLHRAPPDGTWARTQHKLATQPLSVQNVSALYTSTVACSTSNAYSRRNRW
jgi:hypothetical protein